ncbi:Uncharacterised protein [uncultured archaeon]|nr:Uncharacterised protein [uncultured archaeon]
MNPVYHCLNCWKGKRGLCNDFNELQDRSFEGEIEIDGRIDLYRELSFSKQCYGDVNIFGLGG